jgi:hypothetical protein
MIRRIHFILPLVMAAAAPLPAAAQQCCLSELFAGCGSCFRRPPAYAVAPVMAPLPTAPAPVMVPVAKTSYVPETTYRTQMQTVPVTTYKPSCEIDPCTGCPRECMQPVTQYVQQAVNVPFTQYRAVTTTQYVQVPAGYAAPGYGPGYAPAPVPGVAPIPPAPGMVTSPFAPPAIAQPPAVNTAPGAWGAGAPDLRNPAMMQPGQTSIAPPALPPTQTNYPPFTAQRPLAPPVAGTPFVQPNIVPSQPLAGQPLNGQPMTTYVPPAQQTDPTLTQRPLQPAPSVAPPLQPIPETQRRSAPAAGGQAPPPMGTNQPGTAPAPAPTIPAVPSQQAPNPAATPAPAGAGMPTVPGTGPTSATGAFPRLLEPTGHPTSWQPATGGGRPALFVPAYPTAALPARLQQ